MKRRFPEGAKTTFYKRTCIERFAPYISDDGLVTRITRYKDFGCTDIKYIEEMYENRGDKQFRRINDVENAVVIDYFNDGRDDSITSKFNDNKTTVFNEILNW